MSKTYRAFLLEVVQEAQKAVQTSYPIVGIYHHIRAIPYGGAGQRDPRKVYESRLGTCSGKHILLRDTLRAGGYDAEVVTIFTYFNKGIPIHPSMPQELQDIILNADVPDYHHFVRTISKDGYFVKLDATWHDALKGYGFPVNDAWDGMGDTVLAGTPIRVYPAKEDIAALKQSLLTTLSAGEIALRARFLKLLTEWMATI